MLAKPHAGRVEERVRDRGGPSRNHFLTDPGRRLILPLDDDRKDLGRFAAPEDRIADPVHAGDVRARERDLFLQHPARRLDQHAGDLVFDESGVDDLAGFDRAVHALGHDHAGVPVDLDLRDGGAVRRQVGSDRDAPSLHDARLREIRRRFPRAPLRGLGGRIQHGKPAVAVHVLPAEQVRIHVGEVRQFIDHLFGAKGNGEIQR